MKNSTYYLVLQSMRPKQWTKNLILFAALIFSQQFLYPIPTFKTLAAFIIFCVVSGCVYIINDLFDLKQDKIHPIKCTRPLASGALSPTFAMVTTVFLLLLSLVSALLATNLMFVFILLLYFLLQIAYSTVL